MTYQLAERSKAKAALGFIIPLLEKYNFKWVITGGFACYVYGVDRLLTDIDIDIATSKDSTEFKQFMQDVHEHITQPLINYVDANYNNYNFELTYHAQIIDICPMDELLIYNPASGRYVPFYIEGFPPIETVMFEGYKLPLLSKRAIIANKEALTAKDKWQQRDIDALRKIAIDSESAILSEKE